MKKVKNNWILCAPVLFIAIALICCTGNANAENTPNVVCPECGSEETLPIIYGYPSPDLWDEVDKGEVMLGG